MQAGTNRRPKAVFHRQSARCTIVQMMSQMQWVNFVTLDFNHWNLTMNSILNLRSSFWSFALGIAGGMLGLCFNFYANGDFGFGYGVLGVPLGGLVGATLDKNRVKQCTMLFLFVAIAVLLWFKR